jgi:HK97 family phage major capsid protein
MDKFIRKYISFVKEDAVIQNIEISHENEELSENTLEKSYGLEILRKDRDYPMEQSWDKSIQSVADQSLSNKEVSLNKALSDFILHGSVSKLNKFYGGEIQCEGNRMVFPVVLSNYYISKLKDIGILNKMNVILTDYTSLAFPCIKDERNACAWVNNLEDPDLGDGSWDIKLLTLGTLCTCPVVSRDFLFSNDSVEDWLIDMIVSNTNQEIINKIFSLNPKENQYINSIFGVPEKNHIKKEQGHLVTAMIEAISKMDCCYRAEAMFLMSRQFFNELIQEIMGDDKGNNSTYILFQKNMTILGYSYMVLDQIQESHCVFTNIKKAYILAIKNNQHLERDALTKKCFIKYFYSMQVGGLLVNPDAVVIIKDKDE